MIPTFSLDSILTLTWSAVTGLIKGVWAVLQASWRNRPLGVAAFAAFVSALIAVPTGFLATGVSSAVGSASGNSNLSVNRPRVPIIGSFGSL